MERGVVRWGGKGFTVVEREEVRKKKENEEKKKKEIGAEKHDAGGTVVPFGTVTPCQIAGCGFFGAGSTVMPVGTGHPCQFAG